MDLKKILRKILLYVNMAFAVFLILSFLSPYLSPEKIWVPAFLGLAYPYILLVNFIFLLGWLILKRREVVISLLAIVLGWGTLTDYLSLHPFRQLKKSQYASLVREQRKAGNQVKIMSYNVHLFNARYWKERPSTRADILAFVRDQNPDIFCIQEFSSYNLDGFRESEVFRKLDQLPYRQIGYFDIDQRSGYSVATFSHNPIINTGRIPMQGTSICIFSDLLIDRDTFRVYNCHLQSVKLDSEQYGILDSLKFRYDDQQMAEIRDISYRLRDAFIKRAAQADIIAAHISGCPYPVIVCGDFNDTPVSYTYRRIRDGMKDAFSESGWGLGRTYNGEFPSFRIDYILHSESIETLFFSKDRITFSDHYPIIGYLRLKND